MDFHRGILACQRSQGRDWDCEADEGNADRFGCRVGVKQRSPDFATLDFDQPSDDGEMTMKQWLIKQAVAWSTVVHAPSFCLGAVMGGAAALFAICCVEAAFRGWGG
jgi:hypothetical protein